MARVDPPEHAVGVEDVSFLTGQLDHEFLSVDLELLHANGAQSLAFGVEVVLPPGRLLHYAAEPLGFLDVLSYRAIATIPHKGDDGETTAEHHHGTSDTA